MFKKKKYTVIRQAISKDPSTFVANYFLMQKQVYDTCKASRYFSPFENIFDIMKTKMNKFHTYSQYGNIKYGNFNVKVSARNGKGNRS